MACFLITLLIMFLATCVGRLLAKGIMVLIEHNLLVASFTQMTRDLRHSKMALEWANKDLRATNTVNKAAADLLEISAN